MNKYGVPSKVNGKINPEYTRLFNLAKGRIKPATREYGVLSKKFGVPSVVDGKDNPEYYKLYRQELDKDEVREYQRGYTRGPGYEAMRVRGWRKQGASIDTYGQYLTILAMVGYKCEICRVELTERSRSAHLDHDHDSGKVRGILCTECNKGLGHFRDSSIALSCAVVYIDEN